MQREKWREAGESRGRKDISGVYAVPVEFAASAAQRPSALLPHLPWPLSSTDHNLPRARHRLLRTSSVLLETTFADPPLLPVYPDLADILWCLDDHTQTRSRTRACAHSQLSVLRLTLIRGYAPGAQTTWPVSGVDKLCPLLGHSTTTRNYNAGIQSTRSQCTCDLWESGALEDYRASKLEAIPLKGPK